MSNNFSVISFHIKSKTAHFRKYYSNSTALSYYIPPRTTIIGLIAGILGYDKDSYYEEFSSKNCNISIKLCSKCKKSMQTLNYLKVESKNHLNGSNGITQTPLELIIPENIRSGFIDYQVFISHTNQKIMDQLNNLLNTNSLFFKSKGTAPAIGSAFNICNLEQFNQFQGEVLINDEGNISSIVQLQKLTDNNLFYDDENEHFIIKERMPVEFDKARKLTEKGLNDYFIEMNLNEIRCKFKEAVKLDNGEIIMWME